ncbi:MAG: ROK family protein [Bacteroidales bacterium]|nr:ROK family protein [Bacteroidales bacterium]
MKTILLDVGGTFIKCSDGRTVAVDSDGSREEIVRALRCAVSGGAGEDVPPSRVRVAVPGPFDYASGTFLMRHKFAAVYGENFADLAGLPRECFRYVHDVVAMLLGNVAPGSPNTALLTLGTGLGFALYVDGKVLKNDLGSPSVPIYNRPYREGVLEDFVSKRGIVGRYGNPALSVKEIAERAFGGDERARRVFSETGEVLGENIALVLSEYGIQDVLLGGQISRSWQLFAPALARHLPSCLSVRPIKDFDNATFEGLSVC